MNDQQTQYDSKIREVAYAGDSVTYGFDVKHDNRDLQIQVQFSQDKQFNPTTAPKLHQSLWQCRIGSADHQPHGSGQGSGSGQGAGTAQTGTAMATSAQAWNSPIPGADREVQQFTRACISKFMSTHANMAVLFDMRPDSQDRQQLLDAVLPDLDRQLKYRALDLNGHRYIVPDRIHDQWNDSLTGYTPSAHNV